MQRRHLLAIALATALVALPASSQKAKNPPTNLYIDVLTHNMAGMPDMGGMMGGIGGFMARRMGGAESSKPTYPTARVGGMTGQYLDMALHNELKPGIEATDLIPGGLNLGKSAGGSLAEHLHMHVVPRWSGDANFITIIGGSKVVPQLLRETRELLATEWAKQP